MDQPGAAGCFESDVRPKRRSDEGILQGRMAMCPRASIDARAAAALPSAGCIALHPYMRVGDGVPVFLSVSGQDGDAQELEGRAGQEREVDHAADAQRAV